MDNESSEKHYAPVDPTYGQRSALPDVEDEEDEDSKEAWAYLRSVRSEASLIPHLLVSNDRLDTHDSLVAFDGYYEDGAYTGVASSQEDDTYEDLSRNQQACYEAIRLKFSAIRSTLSHSSVRPRSTNLSPVIDPHATHSQYNHGFLYTSPALGSIIFMSQDDIILSLRRYESVLNKKNFMMGDLERANLGAWGWSLLAKCRPVQQMDGDDIAVVREVGKSAIRASKKIIRESKGLQSEENREIDEGEIEDSPMDVSKDISDREQSTLFTLDILITIVGEEFGQRDLLDAREIW